MAFFCSPGTHFMPGALAIAWGKFTRYIEVGDDQYAVRQVEVYKKGHVLRYDREHWCDDYGMLIMRKFSKKQKWNADFPKLIILAKGEFEEIWRSAQGSPEWEKQVAASRKVRWGEWAERHI